MGSATIATIVKEKSKERTEAVQKSGKDRGVAV